MFVATAGMAYCWGYKNGGQLGDGTTTDRLTPTLVIGGHAWASISAGSSQQHTCAETTAGDLYCWGENTWGQLGDGTTTNSTVPSKVGGNW